MTKRMRYLWGYKYGTGICPVCMQEEALNVRGKMTPHKRRIVQGMKTTKTPCNGQGKTPKEMELINSF